MRCKRKAVVRARIDMVSLRWTNPGGQRKINMMKKLALFVCFLAVIQAPQSKAQTQTDAERYGPYPTNYKEIVTKWLESQLIDPVSARIDWLDEPKQTDLGEKAEPRYGYLIHFRVNARNRFGAYTGKQSHAALIRNGEVIKGFGFGY
jgi:hypothetical protein